MTESQYLSSTDPAALRTLLVERGLWTEKKCRAFVEACRWEWDRINKFREGRWGQLTHVLSNAEWWNHETGHDLDRAFRASLIREIWGNPWRQWSYDDTDGIVGSHERITTPGGQISSQWAIYGTVWLTYRNGLVLELAKAAVTRECGACGGSGCWNRQDVVVLGTQCKSCKGTGTTPLTGPIDQFRLAVLADALEEAGCTDDGILGHLRAMEWVCECRQCINGGRPSCECRKSGTRPVSHIWTPSGGCWVLQALLR